jgi:hypothetical protein
MEREHAAYEYIKQDGEPVRSLHHALNSKVKRAVDFFVETCIVLSALHPDEPIASQWFGFLLNF